MESHSLVNMHELSYEICVVPAVWSPKTIFCQSFPSRREGKCSCVLFPNKRQNSKWLGTDACSGILNEWLLNLSLRRVILSEFVFSFFLQMSL